MGNIWDIIKTIWNAIKSFVIPSAAKVVAKGHTKAWTLVAEKCADGKAEKVRPLAVELAQLETDAMNHALDGKYTDEEIAVDEAKCIDLITKIGNL